jgi:hypothetical protein
MTVAMTERERLPAMRAEYVAPIFGNPKTAAMNALGV